MDTVTLLTDEDGTRIGCLKKGYTEKEIKEAVKDEFGADEVIIQGANGMTLTVVTKEDGEEYERELYLTLLPLY